MSYQKKSPIKVALTTKRGTRKSLADTVGPSKSNKSEDRFRQQPRDIEIPLVEDDYEVQVSDTPRTKRKNVPLILYVVSHYLHVLDGATIKDKTQSDKIQFELTLSICF